MSKGVVLCYSGGLDSTVALYWFRHRGYEVKALCVDYGQRHRRELGAACRIADRLRVELKVAPLSGLGRDFLAGSSQTDPMVEVPEGHYADESMRTTVVPNRNMLLLALAGAWAVAAKVHAVGYACHAGDHAIYPDCRPEFVQAMRGALTLCDYERVELLTPFVQMSKADIVAAGRDLGVPFEETWTCYKGGANHCGKCGSCTERREAFRLAGVLDPTEYE